MKKILLMCMMLVMPLVSNAFWTTDRFNITTLYVSGEANFHFRVYGVPGSCTSGFAYINQNDGGSKTYIAALMMAYSMQKQVSLVLEAAGGGYCHILEAILHN